MKPFWATLTLNTIRVFVVAEDLHTIHKSSLLIWNERVFWAETYRAEKLRNR